MDHERKLGARFMGKNKEADLPITTFERFALQKALAEVVGGPTAEALKKRTVFRLLDSEDWKYNVQALTPIERPHWDDLHTLRLDKHQLEMVREQARKMAPALPGEWTFALTDLAERVNIILNGDPDSDEAEAPNGAEKHEAAHN